MIVVADTSPINYLLLIGHIDLLPRLYQRVIIPSAVAMELSAADTPEIVKSWIGAKPEWLDIREIHDSDPSRISRFRRTGRNRTGTIHSRRHDLAR